MKRIAVFNQGEIRGDLIEDYGDLLDGLKARVADHAGGHIISHSESGHHHILSGNVEVLERTENVPAGMEILYAIVKDPSCLKQDAAVPHAPVDLAPGVYEFRLRREYNPFAEEARRVAD